MKLKIRNANVSASYRDLAGDNGGNEGGAGKVVVVGVKLEKQSKELLTWTLMKIADPGDRVIALHVLHSSSEEQSSLISLVRTFDSVLAGYKGFCNLKQVDLRLKVSRGSSVRKILTKEAKLYNGATVIVGTSQTPHTIRSTDSVAKYCARKLSDGFSVFAVDNGKIVFERKVTASDLGSSTDSDTTEPIAHRTRARAATTSPSTIATPSSPSFIATAPNSSSPVASVTPPALSPSSSSIASATPQLLLPSPPPATEPSGEMVSHRPTHPRSAQSKPTDDGSVLFTLLVNLGRVDYH